MIIIAYFGQLPILCGSPHAAAAMFYCISFLDIFSVEWRSVSCQILSPEIYTHLQLGSLHHRVSGWGHYAIFFFFVKNGHILFLFQRTWNHLLLPIRLIFFSPNCNFRSIVGAYFDSQNIMRSSTYSDASIPGGNSLVILFIFILNRVTANILPCGTPSSWFFTLENVVSTQTLNFLSDKNPSINCGNLPFIPSSCRTFITPYFHVV